MRVADKPTSDIENALSEDVLDEALRYAARQLQVHLDKTAATHAATSGVCEPELASKVLEHCINASTVAIRSEYGGYSGLRWLWLLRRLPEWMFRGAYLTTEGADSTLAEVIGGQSSGRSRMVRVGNVRAYPVDGTVIRRLARYCASIQWLAERHRDYRCTGKGYSFEFPKGQVPRRHAGAQLRKSVELYDRRVERGGGLGGMGTQVFAPNASTIARRDLSRSFDGDVFGMLVRVVPIRPVDMEVPAPGADVFADDVPLVTVRARNMVIPVPLESLGALVSQAPPSGRAVVDAGSAALLLLLFASTLHVVQHDAGFIGLHARGYLLSDEQSFRNRMHEAFDLAPRSPLKAILDRAGVNSVDDALALLDQMKGRPWPLEAGPVLYRDEDAFGVDLLAAGRRIADIVFPRVQGALANARSEHFELRVQATVDASSSAPPPEIRSLRGVTLTLGGVPVTDLDAIACTADRQLLFISCKSIIYSPEYDAGKYRDVRNAATTVTSAESYWGDVLARFRANPKGDNYDFTGWDLVGVVCTSTIIWTELGPCTRDVIAGLRAVVSLSELQEWLGHR